MEARTTVYKSIKTGTYYVQPYTIGPVAATWFGEPTVIGPAEFSAKIADAVITNLEKFGKDKFDAAKAIRFSPREQRDFYEQHIEVSIHKPSSGGVIIFPLRRDGGGRVADEEDAIILADADLRDKLPDAISDALSRAT